MRPMCRGRNAIPQRTGPAWGDEEREVQGFLRPGEPPAEALPEADDEEGDPDPEAEEGEPSEPVDLLLRCGEGLHTGVGAEVVPPTADEGRQVGALVDVHAAHRIRRHRPSRCASTRHRAEAHLPYASKSSGVG